MNYSGCFIYSPYYIAKGTQHISYYFARNFFSYKLDHFVRMYRTSWHISTKHFWFLRFPLKENWNQTCFDIHFVLLLLWKEKRLRVQSRYITLGNREKASAPERVQFNGEGLYIFLLFIRMSFFFGFFKFTFLFVMMEKFPFSIVWDSLHKAHSIKDI
jgi:hypothetical protein